MDFVKKLKIGFIQNSKINSLQYQYLQAFWVDIKFPMDSSLKWPWLCPCQVSQGFTVEFEKKNKDEVCQNIYYIDHLLLFLLLLLKFLHSWHDIFNKFLFRMTMNLSMPTWTESWTKIKTKSAKIHYITDHHMLFFYCHHCNSFRVDIKFSINSASG